MIAHVIEFQGEPDKLKVIGMKEFHERVVPVLRAQPGFEGNLTLSIVKTATCSVSRSGIRRSTVASRTAGSSKSVEPEWLRSAELPAAGSVRGPVADLRQRSEAFADHVIPDALVPTVRRGDPRNAASSFRRAIQGTHWAFPARAIEVSKSFTSNLVPQSFDQGGRRSLDHAGPRSVANCGLHLHQEDQLRTSLAVDQQVGRFSGRTAVRSPPRTPPSMPTILAQPQPVSWATAGTPPGCRLRRGAALMP